jgi:S-layer protein (TIGR01567 family)
MTRLLLVVAALVVVLAAAGVGAGALEFSGEVVQLTGAQTAEIVWDKNNFEGFCYDINGSAGTETLTILPSTLEGPDTDRIIDDTWTCSIPPTWQEYELYKSLGLTVDGKSGYWTNILGSEKYVATNGTSNKYTKLLMEFNSTDKKTLATGDSWGMGGGFVLEAAQIDLEADRVWLRLWKDGTVVASKVTTIDPDNRQSRVYTYTKEIAGEPDVPVFSCYIDAIFRGIDSNIMQIKYVFLTDDELVDYSLVYTTHPIWQEYELHKNLGLTVERVQYVGYSGYYRTEFWMGERYVTIGGNASKLAEPLVEFNSTDTKTLTTGEPWDLGGGFVLTAQQIDLEGDKVWLSLSKNGMELDNEIIRTGGSDLQDRVYTYEPDLYGERDVPIFSCYVTGVFRGTDSNIIQVKYVFLIDNDILQISAGEYYGNMKVVAAGSSNIILGNNNDIYLNPNTTAPIMGNLSFKTADTTDAIEFYPHLIRNELPVLSGGGGFASNHCGWHSWDMYENYTIGWNQVDLEGNKAWIVLCKDGVVIDEKVLTEEWRAPVDSDCRYSYVRDGTEIVTATLKAAFRGCNANTIELGEVYQRSEVDGSTLIGNESHLFNPIVSPTGILWDLADDYVLAVHDIGLDGDEVRLGLSKNGVVVKEKILNEDYANTFTYPSGVGGVSCVVDRVFHGCEANAIKLVNVNQYSDVNGTALIVDGSHFYKSGDPDGMPWELMDGCVLAVKDIDLEGDKVWLELSKDDIILKEDILESNDLFEYRNGLESVDFVVEAVFRGNLADVVKLKTVNQYSTAGTQLIDDESKTYATADPPGGIWNLLEGYSLALKDIDLEGEKVWLSLVKNDVSVKDAIIDPRKDGWFTYYNATGALIFSAYVDAVFRGTDTNIIQLKYVSQYSEIDGSVLIMFDETDKKTLSVPSRFPETLTVDDSGGADYTSIQAAVNAAIPMDTIYVHAGEYTENVYVNKRLTLQGVGAEVVTVRAADAEDPVFEVTADWVNVSGFKIKDGGIGIAVCRSSVSISNNDIQGNLWCGIWLEHGINSIVTYNTIIDNGDDGIGLGESGNNNISYNNIVNNEGNGISVNEAGCYGLQCGYNNVKNNNISNNGEDGIYMSCAFNNTILNNNVSHNGYGIHLSYSSNNTLANNIVNSNNYGIGLVFSSYHNTLYHNTLIDNTQNAYDTCTNTWDSGSEGNYYSDYTGTDSNRDGIGETTYDIPGGESVDRYPLTGIRWLPPEITRSRLGINTHWNHWADDLSIYKEKIRNFGIVRDQSGLDNLVKLYQDEDSPELLLLLNLKNADISSFETITADQYYDYVYHVVERYDGDGVSDMPGLIMPVRYFEVGNEVDYIRTNDSRHGYLSPEDYVEKRLIPAYNAAKAANKDAIVMGSGLGMESDLTGGKTGEFNTAYLEAMYDNITANGGNKNNNFYMDKIAIHYYSQNEHPEYFDENIKEVEDLIMNKEGREKPIWITEFAPASTPSLYARLLTLIFANRIEMPVIYNLKDDSEESFGLYDVTCEGTEETITPRESIQVIDTVLSTLHGTTPSENETTSPEPGRTIYQRVFSNSEKKVTVLWYIDDADSGAVTNCMIFPESPQTFTVDVLGTADFPADPSSIHLTIGSEPTYVVETDSPIGVDLYFNKTTAAGVSTERATSFAVGDTLYGKIKTATIADHTVKTYITMTMPDGTCQYAHYDKPDFDPGSDKLLLSDTKIQLYDGVWSATTNDWLWNIYEFTGGDSGIYRWNCWYEDVETGEILGGDSAEYTFSETPSGTPVESATYEGEVYLDSSAGAIENIAAIPPDAMPEVPENLNPVYGFFSFEITGISSGESVNIPLAFPENVPVGTEYWKYGPTPDDTTPHWYQIPVSDDDGDRIIVITLTDGGIGDDDLAVNGVIVDDGGPSLPKKGDLNDDDEITPADAVIALQMSVRGEYTDAADVSGNGKVTSLDALIILQAAAGAIVL